MKLLSHLVQAFKGTRSTPAEEPAEYQGYNTADWREPLLMEAARKHGKPFKCASDELPREIMLGGKRLVIVGADSRVMQGSAPSQAQRDRAQLAFTCLAHSARRARHSGRRESAPSLQEQEF